MPHTPIVVGTPLYTRTKILGNNFDVDRSRGRDKGLGSGRVHNLFSVEGGGVSGDSNFLFSDTVHSGEFVSSFDAVIRGDIIIADELEEEGCEVNLKGIRVDGSCFIHFSADLEPIWVRFEAAEGADCGIFGDAVDVHISREEGAFMFILESPDCEVAFLVSWEVIFSFLCEFFRFTGGHNVIIIMP